MSGKEVEPGESGSTIIGSIGTLLALFFIYYGLTRLWRWYTFQMREFLLFGLIGLVFAVIFLGIAVYGLTSKASGVNALRYGSAYMGVALFMIATYYFVKGFFLGGTPTDIFNALSMGLVGIVFYIIGYASLRIGRKREIIKKESATS